MKSMKCPNEGLFLKYQMFLGRKKCGCNIFIKNRAQRDSCDKIIYKKEQIIHYLNIEMTNCDTPCLPLSHL